MDIVVTANNFDRVPHSLTLDSNIVPPRWENIQRVVGIDTSSVDACVVDLKAAMHCL